MRPPLTSFVTAIAALFLGLTTAAMAQTALTSPIAPGADAPPFSIGGIGPGNVPIAPGAATPGAGEIERIGPGGGLIAPGAAGSVSGSSLVGAPAVPRSRVR